MQTDYDIVIIGGGMVGSSLGLALSQTALRVAVVETRLASEKKKADSGKRAIALSWGSRCLFEQLGVWQAMSASAMPIKHIHVSDRGHFAKTRLSASRQKVDALGYVVEAAEIEMALSQRLAESSVDMFCPAALSAYQIEQDEVRVDLKLGDVHQQISCRLLVGADGAQSLVRQLGGFSVEENDYQQTAITTLLKVEADVTDVAYERFTAEGPIALLPHFDNLYSLVWSLPKQTAQDMLGLSDVEFIRRLQSQFGYWLGELSLAGPRQSFALSLLKVIDAVSDRVVLLGNAAHQVHPVAGQGFNLGLRDAAELADIIMTDGLVDIDNVLKDYANKRKVDQQLITGFTDQVVQLFSSENACLSVLRNSGLLLLDKVPVLGNEFARHAMGLNVRLARLGES